MNEEFRSRIYDNKSADYDRCTVCKSNHNDVVYCVYEILCQCGDSYTGEIERPLDHRFTEYYRCLVSSKFSSYVYKSYVRHPAGKHSDGILDLQIHILEVLGETLEKN